MGQERSSNRAAGRAALRRHLVGREWPYGRRPLLTWSLRWRPAGCGPAPGVVDSGRLEKVSVPVEKSAQTRLAAFAAIIFSGIDIDIDIVPLSSIASRFSSPNLSLQRRCITAANARSDSSRLCSHPPSGLFAAESSAHPTLRP